MNLRNAEGKTLQALFIAMCDEKMPSIPPHLIDSARAELTRYGFRHASIGSALAGIMLAHQLGSLGIVPSGSASTSGVRNVPRKRRRMNKSDDKLMDPKKLVMLKCSIDKCKLWKWEGGKWYVSSLSNPILKYNIERMKCPRHDTED